MPSTRLLLVEDDFLIRLTLAETLAEAGYEVVEAENGQAGVDALHADPAIALAITDLGLGAGMDGGTVARLMRAHRPALPILFMTGRPDAVPALGPRDGLLAKPYLPSEAVAAVGALLASAGR